MFFGADGGKTSPEPSEGCRIPDIRRIVLEQIDPNNDLFEIYMRKNY
jgi:hypothetical protein